METGTWCWVAELAVPWSMGKSDPDWPFLPIPSAWSRARGIYQPLVSLSASQLVGIPQEDKPGSTVLILEMALGFVSAESQFTGRALSVFGENWTSKTHCWECCTCKIPEIALEASLTALLGRGAHKGELLL